MSTIIYDIAGLKTSKDINVENALENFQNQQEFFDALTDFVTNSENFLSEYTSLRIMNRDDERKNFIVELKKIRDILTSLGMGNAAANLKHLENAAFKKDREILESELTEFNRTIKRLSNFVDSKKADSSETQPVRQTTEKHIILAVDDMPPLLSVVVSMLQPQYNVMAVTSGIAALKVIEKHTPSIFLLDIDMPQMNGYELASQIRANAKFQNTPIIFLTAKGTRDDVITAIQHGGNDYMVKPVDKEMLIGKIQRYLP